MQSDGHFENCWSNHALELRSLAPEAGAVVHRGTVLFVADVWPVLDVVELLDADEVGRIVQGRTPAPLAVEVRS